VNLIVNLPIACARPPHRRGTRLGQQVRRLAVEREFSPGEALEEVAQASKDALADTVEKLGRLTRRDLEEEAQRLADLRGAAETAVVLA
jgi:hypothetical protein